MRLNIIFAVIVVLCVTFVCGSEKDSQDNSLIDVEIQGHENTSGRKVRQFGRTFGRQRLGGRGRGFGRPGFGGGFGRPIGFGEYPGYGGGFGGSGFGGPGFGGLGFGGPGFEIPGYGGGFFG